MNPMTNVKNVKKLSEQELRRNSKTSWHDQYKGSAWIFVGGLPYDLTEGDVICVFSQYGEVVNINLVRDKGSGKSKGFCFLCYEDQRSTVLAVDNFNGIKLLGRTIRVDHVADYKPPKDSDKLTDESRKLIKEGCAPRVEPDNFEPVVLKEVKKEKKEKPVKVKSKKEKKHRKKRKKKQSSSSSSSSSSEESSSESEDDSDRRSKKSKGRHSKKHKKRSRSSDSSSSDQEEQPSAESAKSKRKLLEEKIRVLEQALNSVKNKGTKGELAEQEKPSGSSEQQPRRRYDPGADQPERGYRRRVEEENGSGGDYGYRGRRGSAENGDYGYRSRDGRRGDEPNGTVGDHGDRNYSKSRRGGDEQNGDRERYEDRGRDRDRNRERYRR